MEEEIHIEACTACLKTSCRLYSIHALGLENTYNALVSGLPLDMTGALPQDVCSMCAIQLRKARQLAAKCKRSQTLLLDMLNGLKREQRQLALKDIGEICRVSSLLASPKFTTTHFTPNHYDLHINKEQLESTNTLRLAETDSEESHDATDIAYYVTVEDGEQIETEKFVDDIKAEDCGRESDSTTLDEIKSEDNSLNVAINQHPLMSMTSIDNVNDAKADSGRINDILKSEELIDNLNDEAGDKEIENFVLKVEPVFIDNVTKPTKTKKENKTKTIKQRSPKEKKKPAPKERKKTKKQKWREGKEAKTKLLSEHFNVHKLSLEEQIVELEKTKIKANYVKSPYKCDSCYKGFKAESNYTAHMVKHTQSYGPHECPVCHLFFKSRDAHNNHILKHRWRYTCNACPHQTQSKHQALLHINWHRGTVYKCDLCTDAVFEFETSLHRHRRIHHPSPISCLLCGVGCKDDKGLRMHYDWKHVGISMSDPLPEDAPSCRECDLTFASDAALAKHTSLQHVKSTYKIGKQDAEQDEVERRFYCDDCDETFNERYLYRQHLWKAHDRAAPYIKRGKGRDGASRPKELTKQCHICGRLLHCAAVLRDHLDSHNDAVSHPCPECGKKFPTRMSMRTHWRTHTSRYPCPVCHKTFNAQANRDRHLRNLHTAAKDVQCHYCPKAFTSLEQCRQHELHVHMQKAWPRRVRNKRTET